MEQVRRAARSSSGTRTETTGAPTGSGTPPPSGRPDTGGQPARAARAAAASEVRRRVEVTLRLVLEVLDRRRRPDQLKAFAERSVVDSVSAIARTAPPGRTLGTAVLRRIHITSAGEHAAEICATYVRGRRTLAIAGRFERRKGAWTCTALHLA
ncbi:MAG: Rv3235 family protein [Tomitella sp.]|nr:Rv3235 family protein [Tomitella sp.]